MREASRAKAKAKRTPEARAQRRIEIVLAEMARAGDEGEGAAARPPPASKSIRPRELDPKLRKDLHKTFDQSMADTIDEWRQEADRLVCPKEESMPLAQPRPSWLCHQGDIPDLQEALRKHGNAPTFYGVQRHPVPGRLPKRFEDPPKKEVFVEAPPTDWRSTPEAAVLQRAYSYMLGNIAVPEDEGRVVVSKEMRANQEDLFARNRGRGFWRDEVSSLIAQPLSATAYCKSRDAQLVSCASAPGMEPELVLPVKPKPDLAQKYRDADPRGGLVPPRTIKEAALDVRTVPVVPERETWEFCFSDEAHEASARISRLWRRRARRRAATITRVQKRARGMLARMRVIAYRSEREAAAMLIQAAARGRFGRRVLMFLRMALGYGIAVRDLKSWELATLSTQLKIAMARERAYGAKFRHDAKVARGLARFQARFRGWQGRLLAEQVRIERFWMTQVAVHLQRIYRGKRSRELLAPVRSMVKLGLSQLQARIRGNLTRRRVRELRDVRSRMAVEIQRVYRGHRGRQRRDWKRKQALCASRIAALARGRAAREMVRRWRAVRRDAEAKRLKREADVLKAAVDKELEATKMYLKTREGRAELKEEVRRAKTSRAALKVARQGMSPIELAKSQAIEAFEMFDIDGSGEIDYDEFRRAVSELCIPLSAKQIVIALHDMDEDGNGCVTKDEFVQWHTSQGASASASAAAAGGSKAAALASNSVAGAIKLKLQASKKVRDLSGFTDRKLASRAILARRSERARDAARAAFRKDNPADYWYNTYVLPKVEERRHQAHRATLAATSILC